MEYSILVILFSGIMMAAMLILVAARPKLAMRISGVLLVFVAVAGMLLYGYGFAATDDDMVLVCVRSLFCVCGMFLGSAEFKDAVGEVLFQNSWVELIFWLVHLLALYVTVSATLAAFASRFLGKAWLRIAKWKELHLIYGISEASLDYARELISEKTAVVFIEERPEEGQLAAVSEMGAFVRMDEKALDADPVFLKSLGVKGNRRRVSLYALGIDSTQNFSYARKLLRSLQNCSVPAEQTSLIIQGREDSAASGLQAMGDTYGYGFVTVYQEAGLAARLLVQTAPPSATISFDEEGRAQQDFEAMIIGFGQVGQAVLKNLIMCGQFAGSTFRAAVVSPDCTNVRGAFSGIAEEITKHYDIDFFSLDARSPELYDLLHRRGRKLRYLVICTGSISRNREIADDLTLFVERNGMNCGIFQCSHQGVLVYDPDDKVFASHTLYRPQVLNARTMDEKAMVINHFYMGSSGSTPVDDWMNCDFFSRMSCRASADFMGAMLRIAGKTEREVLEDGWNLSEAQLENLSITEHLRWCAFHFCMGFRPMSREEFESRASEYLAQKEKTGKPVIRIGKNMADRTHACLVSWEELDELSERENAITGKNVNYKAYDTENVLAIPKMLEVRAGKE